MDSTKMKQRPISSFFAKGAAAAADGDKTSKAQPKISAFFGKPAAGEGTKPSPAPASNDDAAAGVYCLAGWGLGDKWSYGSCASAHGGKTHAWGNAIDQPAQESTGYAAISRPSVFLAMRFGGLSPKAQITALLPWGAHVQQHAGV